MNMLPYLMLSCCLLLPFALIAQNLEVPETIALYADNKVPLSKPCNTKEVEEKSPEGTLTRVSLVQNPRLSFWINTNIVTKKAILLIPGGGYSFVSVHNEGLQMAKVLLAHSYDVYSLIYRLPSDDCQTKKKWVPFTDAMRALQIIWERGYDQVFVIGFSAGGHLAASLATLSEKNPYFEGIKQANAYCLVYPVVSLQQHPHTGTHTKLLGNNPDAEASRFFSLETQVSSTTPPSVLIHAVDDKGVLWQNSDVYFKACIEKGVKSALHLFPSGGHGFGIGRLKKSEAPDWIPLALDFFQSVK